MISFGIGQSLQNRKYEIIEHTVMAKVTQRVKRRAAVLDSQTPFAAILRLVEVDQEGGKLWRPKNKMHTPK